MWIFILVSMRSSGNPESASVYQEGPEFKSLLTLSLILETVLPKYRFHNLQSSSPTLIATGMLPLRLLTLHHESGLVTVPTVTLPWRRKGGQSGAVLPSQGR